MIKLKNEYNIIIEKGTIDNVSKLIIICSDKKFTEIWDKTKKNIPAVKIFAFDFL